MRVAFLRETLAAVALRRAAVFFRVTLRRATFFLRTRVRAAVFFRVAFFRVLFAFFFMSDSAFRLVDRSKVAGAVRPHAPRVTGKTLSSESAVGQHPPLEPEFRNPVVPFRAASPAPAVPLLRPADAVSVRSRFARRTPSAFVPASPGDRVRLSGPSFSTVTASSQRTALTPLPVPERRVRSCEAHRTGRRRSPGAGGTTGDDRRTRSRPDARLHGRSTAARAADAGVPGITSGGLPFPMADAASFFASPNPEVPNRMASGSKKKKKKKPARVRTGDPKREPARFPAPPAYSGPLPAVSPFPFRAAAFLPVAAAGSPPAARADDGNASAGKAVRPRLPIPDASGFRRSSLPRRRSARSG